jgi:trimeric autotransporter adhesin
MKANFYLFSLCILGFSYSPMAQSGPLTIKNQLIIDSQGSGSGLQFTGMNSTTITSTVPTKVLTLDASGNAIMGSMPTIPIIPAGANIWTVDANNNTATAALSVSIGTGLTIPAGNAYSLYVSKGILAERVRVAVNGSSFWADYVFENSYKLPSLRNVERFIIQNKHLPNVPSAQEVSEKGIDFAEMQATMLRKVEELTLYVIKQDKEIKALRNQMKQLKKK